MATTPQRFGRYEVEALIGEGSMGRVYRAHDPLSRSSVAIKTLKPEYLTREDGPDYERRFAREARAAGQLDHPSIVRILDVGENFFVMELLEGQTLAELLRTRGALAHDEVVRLLEPVAVALDYAHSRGTVHRDVKPGNVMVLEDGSPRLMDFGVAHLQSSVMTAQGEFLGSPAYMAPEQITRSEATPATDRFSLGVVAYEALTGARPFDGDTITAIVWSVVNVEPRAPSVRRPDLPKHVDAVLERALAKDPALRFASARSLLTALRTGESDLTLPPLPRSEAFVSPLESLVGDARAPSPLDETHDLGSAPAVAPRRRHVVLALVAGAAVLAALGALQARRPDATPGTATGVAVPRAALRLQTTPEGAQVFLDGRPAGVTPLRIDGLAPRRYSVRLAMDGYAPAELSLDLPAGPPVPLGFALQPAEAPGAEREAHTTPPRPLQTDPAAYPVIARRLRLQGLVEIAFVVDERGRTSNVRVVRSAGGVLDAAVVEAAMRWRFEPARRDGVAVRTRETYRQKFVLE